MLETLVNVELIILKEIIESIATAFTRFFGRFHWVYLLSALFFALLAWCYHRRHDPQIRNRGFFQYLFPREVWLHRSALLDYRFVIFDKLVLGTFIGIISIVLWENQQEILDSDIVDFAIQASTSIVVAYTIVLVLTEDFSRYWAHRFMHTIPVLWQFHKVHHSPEVLVPFSQMRNHPVNGLINLIRSALAIGIVTGMFMLIFPGQLSALSILGVNAGRFLFYIMGSHLRHSHVWLSYGPVLSYLFISPAQHQIHHSKLPQHIDVNYGSQFAVWDWMFGTLYVPKGREQISLGIKQEDAERLQTIPALYIEPIKDAYSMIKNSRKLTTDQEMV